MNQAILLYPILHKKFKTNDHIAIITILKIVDIRLKSFKLLIIKKIIEIIKYINEGVHKLEIFII
jgi:hypothetical protein